MNKHAERKVELYGKKIDVLRIYRLVFIPIAFILFLIDSAVHIFSEPFMLILFVPEILMLGVAFFFFPFLDKSAYYLGLVSSFMTLIICIILAALKWPRLDMLFFELSGAVMASIGIYQYMAHQQLFFTDYASLKALRKPDKKIDVDTSNEKAGLVLTEANDFNELMEPPTVHVPSIIDRCILEYSYKDVDIKGIVYAQPDFALLSIGDVLTLVSEKDNEADSEAVAVVFQEQRLGYVPNNRLKDMVNDWKKKSRPIHAVITLLDKESSQIQMFMGFYKNPLEDSLNKKCIHTSLIKTTAKDTIMEYSRQENYSLTSPGDTLIATYNEFTDSYIVSTLNADELGELNKSSSEKLQTNDILEAYGQIDEITETENGKYATKITLFY